jgi:hypothetical protein
MPRCGDLYEGITGVATPIDEQCPPPSFLRALIYPPFALPPRSEASRKHSPPSRAIPPFLLRFRPAVHFHRSPPLTKPTDHHQALKEITQEYKNVVRQSHLSWNEGSARSYQASSITTSVVARVQGMQPAVTLKEGEEKVRGV